MCQTVIKYIEVQLFKYQPWGYRCRPGMRMVV